MKAITPSGYITVVGLFFEVSDEQLEVIKAGISCCFDTEFMNRCAESKGDNAHFYHVCNTGKESVDINHFIANVLKEYKTVSWWDKDTKKFKLVRR